jgi:tetratricopeptide (TPR) repeat protein
MINMGNALRRRRELSRASETNSKAAELARALGRKDLEAAALENLGLDALAALRFDQARAYFGQGLETVGADGDPERRASVLLGLSKTETVLGETDPAREHLEAAKTLVEKSGCVALRSALYLAEAVLASHQNRANADALFQQAIETARQAGNLWDEMESLRAWIAHSEKKNDVDQLSRLFARLSEIMARLDQEGTEKKGRYRTGGECK